MEDDMRFSLNPSVPRCSISITLCEMPFCLDIFGLLLLSRDSSSFGLRGAEGVLRCDTTLRFGSERTKVCFCFLFSGFSFSTPSAIIKKKSIFHLFVSITDLQKHWNNYEVPPLISTFHIVNIYCHFSGASQNIAGISDGFLCMHEASWGLRR